MPNYIAILRGINVGGKRKILMADLKLMFSKMGFENVTSYIQSGNILFQTSERISTTTVESRIENEILNNFGFEVPVILISDAALKKAISNNPYYKASNTDIERLHLTFLKQEPTSERLKTLQEINMETDNFQIIDNTIFVYCSGKYSDSKFSNKFFENKLKVTTTTRNWKTILKLNDLLSG